jgi:hypothetical protein
MADKMRVTSLMLSKITVATRTVKRSLLVLQGHESGYPATRIMKKRCTDT